MQKKIHESIFIVCFPFLYQEKEIKEKNYQEKEMQKAKWLSEEALHIAEKRRDQIRSYQSLSRVLLFATP